MGMPIGAFRARQVGTASYHRKTCGSLTYTACIFTAVPAMCSAHRNHVSSCRAAN